MPLRDHFHAPLSEGRHWESFHGAWAFQIMRTLNRRVLPAGYFAEAQAHVGRVEVDVPTFKGDSSGRSSVPEGNGSGPALATWAPSAAAAVMPATFPDAIELRVFESGGGPKFVAAIEFVSPGNKDRREERRAFAAKCASYLSARIGLVIVDIVTTRLANLHDEMIELLEKPASFRFAANTSLYASAYRPFRTKDGDQVEMWFNPLTLGQPLPTMPLALGEDVTVPVDLEGTYMEVCADSRL
jgi:hypothetical protein